METARAAEIERLASTLVVRASWIERVVHGKHEWAVLIGDQLVPCTIDIDIQVEGAREVLVLSVYIQNAPADSDMFILVYDKTEIASTFEGSIRAGRPARLVVRFEGPPKTATPVGSQAES